MTVRHALVLGAATRIGAPLIRCLVDAGFTHLFLADTANRQQTLHALTTRFGLTDAAATLISMQVDTPFAGIDENTRRHLAGAPTTLFHLAHSRDRSLAGSDIRAHNSLMLERVLSIGYALEHVDAIVAVTDVGLVGDYPGRFSESWLDVGQTPFDEVDRSSIEIEMACLQETALPIIRARVGLTLDSIQMTDLEASWPPPTEVLLRSVHFLKRLPRLLSVPVMVAKGSLAPISPADWTAEALVAISGNPSAVGTAVHLVIDSPPTMNHVLDEFSRRIGGPRIRGGLPADMVAKLGVVPGFREMARRNADQIASWWTPHRYCLSRNDLDTAHRRELLSNTLFPPTWASLKNTIR